MTLKEKAFEKIVGKGKNAGYQHFLLVPQCLLPIPRKISVVNPLPHMPILCSSNSAANKHMMSKILTNGDTIF